MTGFLILLASTHSWSYWRGSGGTGGSWVDLTGDGFPELAVAGYYIEIISNNAGTLEPTASWVSSDAANGSYNLVWEDFDKDGFLEMAAIRYSKIAIYDNVGGAIDTVYDWNTTDGLRSGCIEAIDVNGDSWLDLFAGSPDYGSGCRIYMNSGGVLDATASWFGTEEGLCSGADAADFDDDGDVDLAVAVYHYTSSKTKNRIYKNHSGVLETTASWLSDDTGKSYDVVFSDVDNDGDLDLVAANDGVNRVYENTNGSSMNTTASWSSAADKYTRGITLLDIDGDSYPEVFPADRSAGPSYPKPHTRVFPNNAGSIGEEAIWVCPLGIDSTAIELADMDNDGDSDMAIITSDETYVFCNDGGSFETLDLYPVPVWTADKNMWATGIEDLDRDGDLDLIGNHGGSSATVYVYENKTGVLPPSSFTDSWTCDDTLTDLKLGDFNNDGFPDVAVCGFSIPNAIYFNRGGELESSPTWTSSATGYRRLAVVDLDNDDYPELLASIEGGTLAAFSNSAGTLENSPSWTSDATTTAYCMVTGDVDLNGFPDVVVANHESTMPNYIFFNGGGTLEKTPSWQSMETRYSHGVALGDMDDDGDLDLAVANFLQGDNYIYLNTAGVLPPSASRTIDDDSDSRAVDWGDMDGDGDLDLAVGQSAFSPTSLYLNEGSSTLESSPSWTSDDFDNSYEDAVGVQWTDIDGDGDLDLYMAKILPGGYPRIFRNTRFATTNTAPEVLCATPEQASSTVFHLQFAVDDAEQDSATLTLRWWDGLTWIDASSILRGYVDLADGAVQHASWEAEGDLSDFEGISRVWLFADDGQAHAHTGHLKSVTFTVDTWAPRGAECSSPSDLSTNQPTDPVLESSAAVDAETIEYEFLLDSTNIFDNSEGLFQQSGWQTSRNWTPPNNLPPSRSFWWKVRARDAMGNTSNYGEAWRFETLDEPTTTPTATTTHTSSNTFNTYDNSSAANTNVHIDDRSGGPHPDEHLNSTIDSHTHALGFNLNRNTNREWYPNTNPDPDTHQNHRYCKSNPQRDAPDGNTNSHGFFHPDRNYTDPHFNTDSDPNLCDDRHDNTNFLSHSDCFSDSRRLAVPNTGCDIGGDCDSHRYGNGGPNIHTGNHGGLRLFPGWYG